MKAFLPLCFLILFASCTTAYKAGQTPDDVYFSPTRPQAEYVQTRTDDRDEYRGQTSNDVDEERYLRMRTRNRRQWSQLDEYYSDPRAYSYNPYYYNPYVSPYYYSDPRVNWNNWYNPYGPRIVVVNPRMQTPGRPRLFNMNAYKTPEKYDAYRYKTGAGQRSNTTTQPRINAGESLRNVFGSNSNNSSNSSSNNNSNKSSNSGSAPVRKF